MLQGTRVVFGVIQVGVPSGPPADALHRPQDYLDDRTALQLTFGVRPLHGPSMPHTPQVYAGSQTVLVTTLHFS